jgi:hypothetical protein
MNAVKRSDSYILFDIMGLWVCMLNARGTSLNSELVSSHLSYLSPYIIWLDQGIQ